MDFIQPRLRVFFNQPRVTKVLLSQALLGYQRGLGTRAPQLNLSALWIPHRSTQNVFVTFPGKPQ